MNSCTRLYAYFQFIALVFTINPLLSKNIILPKIENLAGDRIRASSAPYISGDTFRSICDLLCDETTTVFDTDAVKDGDIIFLKTDFLSFFFTNLHPLITKKYILVTHNSDCAAPGEFIRYLNDENIIAWFGQNCDSNAHPKFFPIPIGIANRYWPHGNIQVVREAQQQNSASARPILLYLNFDTSTHPERSLVRTFFANKEWCTKASTKPYDQYLKELNLVKFVICPRGNGLDCHRPWEVLLMGAIPIIRHSTIDPLFEGLPVVLINDWDEITEDFLQAKYEQLKNQDFKIERMFADYWIQKILTVKNKTITHCIVNQSKLTEEIFTNIYQNGTWGDDGEGFSGNGSLLHNVQPYVDFLQSFLKEKNIKSIVDFGCGNWNFSQCINWEGVAYVGYDVVKLLIERNNKKWGNEFCKFIHADANRIDLPKADLLICKDVLQHLSNKEIFVFLNQCKKFKYCLITNDIGFHSETTANEDIQIGDWRYIDLTKKPFEIKCETIFTYISEGRKKSVFLLTNI